MLQIHSLGWSIVWKIPKHESIKIRTQFKSESSLFTTHPK